MSFWLILVFPLSHSATTCPPVLCGATSSDTYCMEFQQSTSSYSSQACALSNYTCPNPVHMSETYPLQCEYWIDERYWVSTSWADYYQYTVLSKNDNCDPYGVVSVCDSSSGLVCYCPNSSCYCTDGLKYGVECESNPVPCMPGYVCSNKICTKKYSISAGDLATNSLACISGGPLVVSNGKFTCRQGPTTLGGIPKICTTDNDCISDTGSETTTCSCGLNTDGNAYCELHFNDEPMVNWRNAERDEDYKLEIYWEFISVNYPYLQGNIDACEGNVWRDFYQYKLGEPIGTISSGKYIGALLGIFLLY